MTQPLHIPSSTFPPDYRALTEKELLSRIREVKKARGDNLIILGHHYQRDSIVNQSDFVGDSYELSKKASESEADLIVFCGVRFMAESARILARSSQRVFHPNENAGCPMADMADLEDVRYCWDQLTSLFPGKTIIPIVYMNSSSEIKAFCGEHGGLVCTSSNAVSAYQWAFERGDLILFFPDEHLGTNSARKMNLPPSSLLVWDYRAPGGGVEERDLDNVKVILWKGYCHVHAIRFNISDVEEFRKEYPEGKIVVHPEVPEHVAKLADEIGSTSFINRYVDTLPENSTVAVGTEFNMVLRLQKKHREHKTIVPLRHSLCANMSRIDLPHLTWCLDNLPNAGEVIMDPETVRHARTALRRMLEIRKDR